MWAGISSLLKRVDARLGLASILIPQRWNTHVANESQRKVGISHPGL